MTFKEKFWTWYVVLGMGIAMALLIATGIKIHDIRIRIEAINQHLTEMNDDMRSKLERLEDFEGIGKPKPEPKPED